MAIVTETRPLYTGTVLLEEALFRMEGAELTMPVPRGSVEVGLVFLDSAIRRLHDAYRSGRGHPSLSEMAEAQGVVEAAQEDTQHRNTVSIGLGAHMVPVRYQGSHPVSPADLDLWAAFEAASPVGPIEFRLSRGPGQVYRAPVATDIITAGRPGILTRVLRLASHQDLVTEMNQGPGTATTMPTEAEVQERMRFWDHVRVSYAVDQPPEPLLPSEPEPRSLWEHLLE
jgi:hypothetical protein